VRHVPPPVVKGGLGPLLASLAFGLVVCAIGIVLILQAGLGLAPWDVLHQGISEHTPLSFGMANVAVGVVVVLVAWRLGARIGFGTVANATVIGLCVQALLSTGAIPAAGSAPLGERVGYLAAGIVAFGIGSAFYIGANMGAGPRDSLMLVVALRLHTRLGIARAGIELAVLGVGWALGGEVGVGTVAFALFIGPSVELAFFVLDRSPLARPSRLPAGRAAQRAERGPETAQRPLAEKC
jgi:uncharacterized membrane protein YczE